MGDSREKRPTLEAKRRQPGGRADEPPSRDLPIAAHPVEEAGWEPVSEDSGEAEFGEVDYVVSLLGAALRKGAWCPSERVRVFALMGAATLDFRDAELLEGVTEIAVLSVMGAVHLIVPPELQWDVNGIGLMGTFPQRSQRRSQDPSAPRLRIRGLCLMGSVHVKVA
jgi:hypothetical protein